MLRLDKKNPKETGISIQVVSRRKVRGRVKHFDPLSMTVYGPKTTRSVWKELRRLIREDGSRHASVQIVEGNPSTPSG